MQTVAEGHADAARRAALVISLCAPLVLAACNGGGSQDRTPEGQGGGGAGATHLAAGGAAGTGVSQSDAGAKLGGDGAAGSGQAPAIDTTDLQAQMTALQAQVAVVDGLIQGATSPDAGVANALDGGVDGATSPNAGVANALAGLDGATARASTDLARIVMLAGQSPTPSAQIRAAVVDSLAIDLRLVQAAADALASAVTMNEPRQDDDELDGDVAEVSPLAFALKRQSDVFVARFQEPIVRDLGTWLGPLNPRRLSNGGTLIAECWGNRVVEIDSAGAVAWQFTDLGCPTAAERLPNGNTLIADRDGRRAIEVDTAGTVVWKKEGLMNLYGVQRLDSGNTLLVVQGDYTDQNPAAVLEVSPAGDVVWQYQGDGTPLLAPSAERLANGNTLVGDNSGYFTGTARVLEVDPKGQTVWSFASGIYGIYGVNRLDNGDTLINDQANGRLIEVTPTGDVVWRYGGMDTPGGFDVVAGGGLLISDWSSDHVFEIGPRDVY